ncbi:hypothetical protein K431DRAFT_347490 [Polychaeton citri CBS 116435]|uniref:Uncharacterized protein n=1 Tax=Polychaeton citri CBS 116435 TaxID=1314669 RepID=A0A9P4UPH1_9PEZI|nr:hypothetical protein K431DRAFT_347490 [Polychaeton citri CBS 116435]
MLKKTLTTAIAVMSFARYTMAVNYTIPYTHMWADEYGVSHVAHCLLTNLQIELLSSGDSPQYLDDLGSTNATTIYTVQPAGWSASWHKNPKVQWIIPLQGEWWIRMTDGNTATMGPGQVALGEDQYAKTISSGPYAGAMGHEASNCHNASVSLMIIQTSWTPTVGQPCHVK